MANCIRIRIQLTLLTECGVSDHRPNTLCRERNSVPRPRPAFSAVMFSPRARMRVKPGYKTEDRRSVLRLILDLGERHTRGSQAFSRLSSSHSQDSKSPLFVRKWTRALLSSVWACLGGPHIDCLLVGLTNSLPETDFFVFLKPFDVYML